MCVREGRGFSGPQYSIKQEEILTAPPLAAALPCISLPSITSEGRVIQGGQSFLVASYDGEMSSAQPRSREAQPHFCDCSPKYCCPCPLVPFMVPSLSSPSMGRGGALCLAGRKIGSRLAATDSTVTQIKAPPSSPGAARQEDGYLRCPSHAPGLV